MSNPGIFLIQPNGELVEMNEQAYDSEDLLQMLLAKYPSLLAGNQIDPSAPRKWLFIERESGVPSKEGGSGRWSADHLFLDQDAVPTIVEVKRSSNTRIRREVVGQMLDYAANAVVYWPVDRLRERFAKTHGAASDEKLWDFVRDKKQMKKRNGISEETRTEILRRLNEIPGVNLPPESIDDKKHGIPLSTLANERALEQFLNVIAWVVETSQVASQQKTDQMTKT